MRHVRKKNYLKYMLMSSYFYTHISYLLNFNTNNIVSFDTKYQWPEPSMPFSTHRVIKTWNLQSLKCPIPKGYSCRVCCLHQQHKFGVPGRWTRQARDDTFVF